MTNPDQHQIFSEAPDPILAELWQVKREINKAAEYRIDTLVDMANEAADRVRMQWQSKEKMNCSTSEDTATVNWL